jgi:DNA polymerase/3'-5' exonuclease PolX
VSRGPSRPFADVAPLAVELLRLLEPACETIVVAGSLRRRRPFVSDIELVAKPRLEEVRSSEAGLFDAVERIDVRDRTEELIGELLETGTLTLRDVERHRADGSIDVVTLNGPRHKALAYRDVPVDLFVVRPPAQFGCVLTIRTGPADWSQELVTRIQKYSRRVEDGRLLRMGQPVATPDEASFLRECGQAWVEPRERSAARVRIDPAISQAVPA